MQFGAEYSADKRLENDVNLTSRMKITRWVVICKANKPTAVTEINSCIQDVEDKQWI